MKYFFTFVAVAFASLFVVGCSSLSVNGPDSQIVPDGKSAIHFTINLGDNPTALAKTAAADDSLTVAERKANLVHLISRISSIQLQFKKVGSNPYPPTYSFNVSVKSGTCDTVLKVDSGSYYVECYTYGKIKVGSDTVSVSDFQYQSQTQAKPIVEAGKSDTTEVSVPLHANGYYDYGLRIMKGTTPLNGQIDSLLSVDKVVDAYAGQPTAVNGYVTYVFFNPVKRNMSFYLGGKKYVGFFDITKGFDDDVVEMTVVEIAQSNVNATIVIADNLPPVVDSVFPKDGAVNVPCNIMNVTAYFNKQLAGWPDMPGAGLGVASEDGSDQITGTCGISDNFFSRNLDNGTARVYLKPNTKYIAHVSAVKDEYGNVMVGEKRWSFTTGS